MNEIHERGWEGRSEASEVRTGWTGSQTIDDPGSHPGQAIVSIMFLFSF